MARTQLPQTSFKQKVLLVVTLACCLAGRSKAQAVKLGNLHAVSTNFIQKETIRVELIPGMGQVVGIQRNEKGEVDRLIYDGLEFVKQK